jgi:putative transcriptional regulator
VFILYYNKKRKERFICDQLIKYNITNGGETWLFIVGKCLLADRLKKADLTQSELAELTHIPKSTISEYVNNKHIMSLVTAKTIAHTLNCSIDDLYQWKSVRDARIRK